MTRTEPISGYLIPKGGLARFVEILLGPEGAGSTLTMTIRPLPLGEFFVSGVTLRSEDT
jgi:hypothetical protein